MISQAQKRYLFAIYMLGFQGKKIKSTEVAKVLGVTKSSTVKMTAKLIEDGYIIKEPYREIRLTDKGVKAANDMFTPGIILKDFLVNSVGIDENSAREDSIAIVTHLSDSSLVKLTEFAFSIT